MSHETYIYRLKKVLSISLLALISIYLIFSSLVMAHSNLQKSEKIEIYDDIGGNFTLHSSNNINVSLKDYQGKVVVLIFGYTTCPDTCPITLNVLKHLMNHRKKTRHNFHALLLYNLLLPRLRKTTLKY